MLPFPEYSCKSIHTRPNSQYNYPVPDCHLLLFSHSGCHFSETRKEEKIQPKTTKYECDKRTPGEPREQRDGKMFDETKLPVKRDPVVSLVMDVHENEVAFANTNHRPWKTAINRQKGHGGAIPRNVCFPQLQGK